MIGHNCDWSSDAADDEEPVLEMLVESLPLDWAAEMNVGNDEHGIQEGDEEEREEEVTEIQEGNDAGGEGVGGVS